MVGLAVRRFSGFRRTVSRHTKLMPNQMTDAMDSSYGNAPVSPPDTMPGNKAPKESVDAENAGAAEILIAKDKLPTGTKEGDTCTFKVSKDVGDEFILEYVKEDNEETPEPTRDNIDETTENEISALDQKGQ